MNILDILENELSYENISDDFRKMIKISKESNESEKEEEDNGEKVL